MTDVIDQPQAGAPVAVEDSGTAQAAPPAAPPPAPLTAQPSAPTVDVPALQRYLTQTLQRNALLVTALGVSKDATDAQIQAAGASKRARREDDASPELAALQAQHDEVEWEYEIERSGDIGARAREMMELAQHGGRPRAYASTFREAVLAVAKGLSAQGSPPDAAPQPPTAARPAQVTPGSEPPLTQAPLDAVKGRENSGDAPGYFRAIREALTGR